MRNTRHILRLSAFLGAVAATVAACGGGGETAQQADTTMAAAAPAPAPQSYTLVADDGTWTVDITPANIVWHHKRGSRSDSIVFDYKEPTVDGALYNYTSILMAADTHRIDITLAMTKCTDNANKEHSYQAQVWVDQAPYKGCADSK
jgi:uncharacterized membrane protein